jgi:nucleotide-binding universal stress UspA family protein
VSAIVVGTDGSAEAERAVRRAVTIAKGTGAQLHLVTAYPDGSYRESIAGTARTVPIDLREAAEGVLARDASHAQSEGVDAATQAGEGDPAQVLIDVAQEGGRRPHRRRSARTGGFPAVAPGQRVQQAVAPRPLRRIDRARGALTR